jgi:hypothetical protein
MATLTGNTVGPLKKMFPPVKRKAIDAYPSLATFLGGVPGAVNAANGDGKKAAPKAATKKRKATSPEPDTDDAAKDIHSNDDKTGGKANGKTKAPAKGRGRTKKVKTEQEDVEELTPEVAAETNGMYTLILYAL